MPFVPSFKLYAEDGVSLVYTFEHVFDTNWPQDNPSSIEYTNTRSTGAITIPEGDQPYDIFLDSVLLGDDYTALTAKIFALRDTVVANTRYVLKCEKSIGIFDSIKVMRKVKIYLEKSKRINNQKYKIILNALAWA